MHPIVRQLLAIAFIESLYGGKDSFMADEMQQRFDDCEITLPNGTDITDIIGLAEEALLIQKVESNRWKMTTHGAARESFYMFEKKAGDMTRDWKSAQRTYGFQDESGNKNMQAETHPDIPTEGLLLDEKLKLKLWK